MKVSFASLATLLTAVAAVEAAIVAVNVGDGGFQFNPTNVNAAQGDTVVFTWKGNAHSVTQSTFAAPCTAMSGGVDSDFKNSGATFNFTVTDANPVWFHCKQVGHCNQSGMVFAINPSSTQTFAAFQAAAKGGSTSAPASTSSQPASGGNDGYGYGYGGGGALPQAAAVGWSVAVVGALLTSALFAV